MRDLCGLLFACLLFCLPLALNPGFFNHDELQKADHIAQFGLADYLAAYSKPLPGKSFGEPMRPLSMVVLGLNAVLMASDPRWAHLVDILMHCAVCCALYGLLRQAGQPARPAFWSSALFAASPLATQSVGWIAALMDRLYVLFLLLAAIAGLRLLGDRVRRPGLLLAAAFACVSLAMLSKETALIAPLGAAVLVVYTAHAGVCRMKDARAWQLAGVAAIPVILLLAYRWPAIVGTLQGVSGPYAVSLSNVPRNLIIYAAYPFLLNLDETGNFGLIPQLQAGMALAIHGVLLCLLWRKGRWPAVGLYASCYFLPLVPVMPLAGSGSHYLYASGAALAAATGWLSFDAVRARRWTSVAAAGLIGLLLIHAWRNQESVAATGRCMRAAIDSMEMEWRKAGEPRGIHVAFEPGAPQHIIHRFTFGRKRIGWAARSPSRVPVEFQIAPQAASPGSLRLAFTPACRCLPAAE